MFSIKSGTSGCCCILVGILFNFLPSLFTGPSKLHIFKLQESINDLKSDAMEIKDEDGVEQKSPQIKSLTLFFDIQN